MKRTTIVAELEVVIHTPDGVVIDADAAAQAARDVIRKNLRDSFPTFADDHEVTVTPTLVMQVSIQ